MEKLIITFSQTNIIVAHFFDDFSLWLRLDDFNFSKD